jgi:hypothetical protein
MCTPISIAEQNTAWLLGELETFGSEWLRRFVRWHM